MFNQQKKIYVVGDVILDEFVFGEVSRISPEAPVPIFNKKKSTFVLGGAANVANNIGALGGECTLIGRAGDDIPGMKLKKLLEQNGIKSFIITDYDYDTPHKTRFLAQNQQLLRTDKEKVKELRAEDETAIAEKIGEESIVIISDYEKGIISDGLINILKPKAKLIVDPKTVTKKFEGVYLLKPNLKAAAKYAKTTLANEEETNKAGLKIMQDLNTNVLITRGADGISLFEKGKNPKHVCSQAKEVYDVTGAGDTVIATLALSLASGKNLEESTIIANAAAGIVVGKVGTATLTQEELAAKINLRKAVFLDRDGIINKEIGKHVTDWNEFSFIDGIFDALRQLKEFELFVFTNQSCISKGLASRQAVDTIHNKMLEQFKCEGIAIKEILCCPHGDCDNCSCRKPKPGMLLSAAEKHGINLASSYVIGDSERDIEAGKAAGCKTILVLTGKIKNAADCAVTPDYVCNILTDAVNICIH